MKMYFSKLAKVLLAGVVFVAVGCTDYKEDIENLDAKIENDVVAGMIEPLKADLEKAVADLEAAQAALKSELTTKHDADVKTLKDADAALDGKIAAANQSILDLQAALAAEKAALEAEIDALETALAAAKKEAADADAALEAKLVKEINDLETELLAKVTELQAKHDKDIADLKKIVDDNKAAADAQFKVVADQVAALQLKDTELEAELAKQAKLIADLDAKVDANYKELSETIEAVRKNLQEQVYANKAAIDANTASINAIIADAEQLTADVRALEQKVYGIEGDLVKHLEEYANYKAVVAGKLEAMQAAHDALVARVADLEENVIPAMKAQIAKNAELANQNAAEIAKNAALFEQYKQAAQQTYEQLLAADAKLAESIALLGGDIKEVDADLQAYKATIEGLLQEHYEAYEQYKIENDQRIADAVATENAHYLELNAKHNAQEAALAQLKALLDAEIAAREQGDAALRASIASLEDVVDALAARVAVLEAGLAELKAAHEELAADYEAFKKQISSSLINSINALQEQMALNNAAIYGTISDLQVQHNADVAALKEADKNLHKSIQTLAITLDKAIEAEAKARKNADDALQEQIDSILAMIQSVVYVPEYTDGKATINYAVLEGKPVEGISTMIYKVYPAECADALALIDAEKLVEHLSFDLTDELKVRNVANGPKLTVVGVETVEGKPGHIAVSFKASNLGASFYNNEVEYATSLHIVYGDADLSSCYTNLVCVSEPIEISVKILMPTNDDKVVDITNNDHYETYELVYNDVTTEVSFLNGHIIAFSIDGTNYYNDDEFTVQTGFDLLRYKKDTNSKTEAHYSRSFDFDGYFMIHFVSADEPVKNMFIAPSWESYKKARLAEANADLIGKLYHVGYRYSVGAQDYTAGADVLITKEKATANLTPAESLVATWNYVEDAEVDADKLVNGDAATLYYQRDFELDLTAAVTEKLPEDTELADVLVSAPTSVKVNGVDATDMVSFSKNAEGNVVLNFSHFAWNKEYTVVVKYSLQNVDVEVTFVVKTVDRDRKTPVKVEQTFDGYVFAKDYAFAAFDGVAPEMAINKVYTDVAALYDLTGIEEAAYLKEVFVTKAPYSVADTIAPTATLDYLFNAAGDKVSVAYAYDAWTEIPMEVTYTKNLNLWYGQEVELVVKVVIALPTNYNFEYSILYVKNGDACDGASYEPHAMINGLFSSVYPFYDPDLKTGSAQNGVKLRDFNTEKVDMDKAFNIVDTTVDDANARILTAEQIAEAGLVADFELEETYDFSEYNAGKDADAQRVLEWAEEIAPEGDVNKVVKSNKLIYNADVCHAPVTGNLYIVNSNGSKLKLKTNFDTEKAYQDYVVKKYDPILDPVLVGAKYAAAPEKDAIPATTDVIDIEISSAIEYVLNPLLCIELKDYRNGYKNFDLINRATGEWVKGGKSTVYDGFAEGRDVRDIYKLGIEWTESPVPAQLRKVIYMTQDNKVVFDNTGEQVLVEPFTYTVTLKITSPWGTHSIAIPFRFYQGGDLGKTE